MTTLEQTLRDEPSMSWSIEDNWGLSLEVETLATPSASAVFFCDHASRLASASADIGGSYSLATEEVNEALTSDVLDYGKTYVYAFPASSSLSSSTAEIAATQEILEKINNTRALLMSSLLRRFARNLRMHGCVSSYSQDRLYLEAIRRLYSVQDDKELKVFLEEHPNVIRPLISLYSEAHRYFPEARIALEVSEGTLFAFIETPASYDEGLESLDELDQNWYMNLDFGVIRHFEVDIRFV